MPQAIELDQPRIILHTFTEEETQREELDFEFEDEFIPEEEVPKDAEDLEFGSMDTFILNSVAFENMVRRLNDFVNPSFRSQAQKLVEKVLKNCHTEQNEYRAAMKKRMHTVITELEESRSSCILLDVENTKNRLDRLQIWLETVTGEAWNWWPLHSPKYAMRPTEVRVGWQCVSFPPKCPDRANTVTPEMQYKKMGSCSRRLWRQPRAFIAEVPSGQWARTRRADELHGNNNERWTNRITSNSWIVVGNKVHQDGKRIKFQTRSVNSIETRESADRATGVSQTKIHIPSCYY